LKEFSLENIAENIHFGKTKVYFTEVLSSYHNCNYRSSVVMLWSVSVCDIIYKLQYLVDLYADSAAKEILDEITCLMRTSDRACLES
jgi:L-ribulose-5-phosphate 3-epimerase UlaE